MHNNDIGLESNQRVIADIGGTNARFALLAQDGSINNEIVLNVHDYQDFSLAYKDYLSRLGNPIITEAAIAIANPVLGDKIKMTNHTWAFSIEETRQNLKLDSLVFKNDFEALAQSIPVLSRSDCRQVGGDEIKSKSPIGILGPGTGLGVASLIYADNKWIPIPGEGGHVTLSPTSSRESQILEECWKQYSHVSAERLISGGGMQLLYKTLCQIEGIKPEELLAKEISKRAIDKTDKQCIEALEVFCSLLGVVAGNLALTLGAKGGIYIGGGIIPKLGVYFENSRFREQFDAKGRFHEYLKEIPVFVIHSKHPALLGISQEYQS